MSTATLAFDIIGRDKASAAFGKVGSSADKSSSKMAAFGKVAKVGLFAVGAAAAGASVALVGMAKAAMADQQSQALLAKQLKNSAGATHAQVAATEKWISKQGVALGVTDDELRPALAKLTAVTKDVGKAQALTSLAMDVSAGTGKSLSTVSAALAKAQLGQVSGLSKLGVATKNADGSTKSLKDITAEMAKTYSGAASTAANTAQGKFDRLKLIFDETKESIGAKLLPVLTSLATWFLAKGLPAVQKFGGWLGDTFGPVIGKMVGWFKNDLLPALGSMYEKALPALQSAFGSVKKALSNAQPYFDLLGDILVNIVLPVVGKIASVALPLLGKGLEGVGKIMAFQAGVIKKLASAFLFLGEYGVKAFRLLLTAAFAVFGGILAAADKGLSWIPGLGGKISDAKKAFDEFGTKTIEKLKGVEDSLRDTRTELNKLDGKKIRISVAVTERVQTLREGGRLPGGQDTYLPREVTGKRSAGRILGRPGPGSPRPTISYVLDELLANLKDKTPLLKSAMAGATSLVQKYTGILGDLMAKRRDVVTGFTSGASSVFAAAMPDDTAPTAAGLVVFQQQQRDQAVGLRSNVAKLLKMGLSRDLIQQMASAGPSGYAQIAALAAGSSAQIAQLNALNAQTNAALTGAGTLAGNALYGAQIDKARDQKDAAVAIATELRKVMREANDNQQIVIKLEGKTLQVSLLQLKRNNGNLPLGLS